jgi:predicted thioesterase
MPLRDVIPELERPSEPTLAPGLERIDEFDVADRLLTDVGGTIGVKVLSTPGLIAVMERNSAVLSLENLPEGQATVGFEVCVKHVAPAAEGARCTVRSTLRETDASCASTSRSPKATARSASAPTSAA